MDPRSGGVSHPVISAGGLSARPRRSVWLGGALLCSGLASAQQPSGFDDLLRLSSLVVRGELVDNFELSPALPAARHGSRSRETSSARLLLVRGEDVLTGVPTAEPIAVLVEGPQSSLAVNLSRGTRGVWFLGLDPQRGASFEIATAAATALGACTPLRLVGAENGLLAEQRGECEAVYSLYVPSTITATVPGTCSDCGQWTAPELGALIRGRRAWLARRPLLEVERRYADPGRGWTFTLAADLSYRRVVAAAGGERSESGMYPLERWFAFEPLRWSASFWSRPALAAAPYLGTEFGAALVAPLGALPGSELAAEQATLRLYRGEQRLELVLPLAKAALWRRGAHDAVTLRAFELWMALPAAWRAE
jgi:hypothetical protein